MSFHLVLASFGLAVLTTSVVAQSPLQPDSAALEVEVGLLSGSRRAEQKYVQKGLGGLHLAASWRPWRSSTQALVFQATRVVVAQWPLGDRCIIDDLDFESPPICRPYLPSFHLFTVGWELTPGHPHFRASAAIGRLVVGSVPTLASVLRVQLTPHRGILSLLVFGQLLYAPKFEGGVLQSVGVGAGAVARL